MLVFAVQNFRKVQLRILACDALSVRMFEVVPYIGGMKQRLCGNAADQQACPAQSRICFQ